VPARKRLGVFESVFVGGGGGALVLKKKAPVFVSGAVQVMTVFNYK
jgi:hypothetical protein